MHTLRPGALSACGCGLLLAAVGCGGRTETAPQLARLQAMSSEVSSLEFTRTISDRASSSPTLTVAVKDANQAQALFRATLELPEANVPSTSCPSDADVVYQLTFRGSDAVVMQVVEEPDGCERVTIIGAAVPLVAGSAYWARLSQGLGVPESIMYPTPQVH